MTDARISLLLDVLDRAFDGRAWHGTTLRGAVRGVAPDLAVWRPGRGRHNIWELMLHTAYWKYAVRRRIVGSRERFSRAPANWPAPPRRPTAEALAEDVALLEHEHARLRLVVEGLAPSRLGRRLTGRWTVAEQIHGVSAHDLYHTGQMQLIKQLAGARRG